jgi:ABC-type histidine transport system ATPase subunit
MEPEVMLFDEPTSALDPQLIQEVARMLRALDDLGKTLVVVSHDMNFARRISDQVIYFEGGHAVEAGTPQEVFNNPQAAETRAFMKSFQEEESPLPQDSGEELKLDTAKGTRGSLGQEE